MPLYEYGCRRCGHQFEMLIRDGQTAVCAACASDDVERQPSLFGVSTEGTREASRTRARRSAELQHRDRVIAEREWVENHHH